MAHSKTSLSQVLSQIAVGTGIATVFGFSIFRERGNHLSENNIDFIKSLDQAAEKETSGEVWKSHFVSTRRVAQAHQRHGDESTT